MKDPVGAIKKIGVAVIIVCSIAYIAFQSRNLIIGPVIDVFEPKNGVTLLSQTIDIRGNARNIAYLYLNDRQIYADTSGYFREKLIVPEGYSIIKLSAKDKFGRKTEKKIEIFTKVQDSL